MFTPSRVNITSDRSLYSDIMLSKAVGQTLPPCVYPKKLRAAGCEGLASETLGSYG